MRIRITNRLRIEVIPNPAPIGFADRVSAWLASPPMAYKLTDDLIVEIDGGLYTVFAGTLIDGFTVPRGFRWIIAPMGPYAAAAAVHDAMYVQGYESKEYADTVFYELLKCLGCPRWAAWLAYQAVKRFGEGNYRNGR